jgi:NADH:ubiquinone oxidoreductase subunit 5 (subunit L)/multisubunit Na+/H+ antiporter MnhA subunit/multisubunit Na+/H+ antiporter MnhB subunit
VSSALPIAIQVLLVVLAPALLAVVVWGARRSTAVIAAAAALGSVTSATVGATLAGGAFRGVARLTEWVPGLGVSLDWRVTTATLSLAILVAGIGALVAQYAGAYFRDTISSRRAMVMLALFQSSMLGLVLADNLLLLFVFWELTGITSFFLIGMDRKNADAFNAARRALVITAVGALPMLAGILVLAGAAGSASLAALAGASLPAESQALAFALILLGVLTKSAQVPFHSWLPGAMAAPTPVSAYLHSATMVKAGVILLLYLYPALGDTPLWTMTLVPLGAMTCVWGSFRALGEHDIKLLMAWSTVSQLGLLTLTIGLGTDIAIRAAVLHLFAHAVFKAGLFLTVGGIEHASGTRSLLELGGLRRTTPVLFVAAAILAGSMAGIPPLAGFLSKELILKKAMLAELWTHFFAVTAIGIGSVGTVAYSSRFVFEVFTGSPRSDGARSATPLKAAWLVAPVLLASVTLAAGPGASWVDRWFLEPVTAAFIGTAIPQAKPLSLWYGINAALIMSVAIVALGYGLDRALGLRLLTKPAWLPSGGGVFDAILGISERTGRVCARVMADSEPRAYYAIAILAGFAAATPLLGDLSTLDLTAVPHPATFTLILLATTLGALVGASSRLARVLLLSAAGFAVAILYRLMNAPDLILTQLLVEVLVTIFFALALRRLASSGMPRIGSRSLGAARIAVSGLAGLVAGALVLRVGRADAPTHVRDFYAAAAPVLAKGLNAVNVVLTDFRALDTQMETLVVAIAALGVAGLLRGTERDEPAAEAAYAQPARRGLLASVARLIVSLAAVFALSLLVKGHDEPGGGFVAGLGVGVAGVLALAAFGRTRPHRAAQSTALVGLGIMMASSLGPLLFGAPALTHAHGVLPAGVLSAKWHTALIFDVGVVLVVGGAVAAAAITLWGPVQERDQEEGS